MVIIAMPMKQAMYWTQYTLLTEIFLNVVGGCIFLKSHKIALTFTKVYSGIILRKWKRMTRALIVLTERKA